MGSSSEPKYEALDESFIESERKKNQRAVVIGVSALIILVIVAIGVAFYLAKDTSIQEPQNLVLIIADGMGFPSLAFTREMGEDFDPSNPKPLLPLDEYIVGMSRTYSANSLVTDSAAGATVYSCLIQTNNDQVASTTENTACATILEAAKRSGFATGVVTNARVTHATPASFTAHVLDRDEEEEIARQQTYNFSQSVDLLYGGGREMFTDREDGENLLEVFTKNQIEILNTSSDLETAVLPSVGLFAESHLDYMIDHIYAIDNETIQQQPLLSEMVSKALSLLARDGRRFILVVETGRIDHASHSNDPAAHYYEMDEYMNTIEVIQNFLEEDSKGDHTAVFATSDHATGGISTGSNFLNGDPGVQMWNPPAILNTTASMYMMATQLANGEDLNDVYFAGTGIDLRESFPEQYQILSDETPDPQSYPYLAQLAAPLNNNAMVGFTTLNHTGMDVPVYNFGRLIPGISGVMNNFQFGEKIGEAMGLMNSLTTLNNRFSNWTLTI